MNLKNENWKKAYNKLAEYYFDLQHKYDTLLGDFGDLQEELTPEIIKSSCCGQTTFVADSKGVIDRPLAGTYYVTLIVTDTPKENV